MINVKRISNKIGEGIIKPKFVQFCDEASTTLPLSLLRCVSNTKIEAATRKVRPELYLGCTASPNQQPNRELHNWVRFLLPYPYL